MRWIFVRFIIFNISTYSQGWRSVECALQLPWDSWSDSWQMNSLQTQGCELCKNCLEVSFFVLCSIVARLSRYDNIRYDCHTRCECRSIFTSLLHPSHFTYLVWFFFLTIFIHKMTTRFYFVCIFLFSEWMVKYNGTYPSFRCQSKTQNILAR